MGHHVASMDFFEGDGVPAFPWRKSRDVDPFIIYRLYILLKFTIEMVMFSQVL